MILLNSLIRDLYLFFFFNDTATTEIYTLSLHDALPIYASWVARACRLFLAGPKYVPANRLRQTLGLEKGELEQDRKSTRLNSSHANISYAVFCLKKKTKIPPLLPYTLVPYINRI